MRKSPLKISGFRYPIVSVRATPEIEPPDGELELAQPSVTASVGFSADGDHFAIINVRQGKKGEPYTFEIEAFTSFQIDVDACVECYRNGWTPATLAVNIARLLYSGVRECLATITSRAPYGIAALPSTTLGPEDVQIGFEPGEEGRDEVLKKFFNFTEEKIAELNKRISAAKAERKTESLKKSARRASGKRPEE